MSGWFFCEDVSSINDHCLDLLIHGQIGSQNAGSPVTFEFQVNNEQCLVSVYFKYTCTK